MGDARRCVDGRCFFADARKLGTFEGDPRERVRLFESRQGYEAGTDQFSGKAGAAIGFGPDLPDSRVPFQGPGLWDRIKESHLDRFRTPASRRPEMHDARNRVPLEDCRAPTITATIDAFSDSSAGVGSSHLGIACCSCWQCLFGADRGQEAGPTSRRFGMK